MCEALNPKNAVRECCITEEHKNPIPVILALDVTGSMGDACIETAEALGTIISSLYEKYDDIEFLMMGIGDLDYDTAPIQAGQFESDIRIAKDLDKIYMEHGGGGNRFESYSAAWYFALHNTAIEPIEKQNRKGIIITMGDEPMNPYLPHRELNAALGCSEQSDVETEDLYAAASEKFDIFHIAVDDRRTAYRRYREDIEKSFGNLLGNRLKTATVNGLSSAIIECIDESVSSQSSSGATAVNGKISW